MSYGRRGFGRDRGGFGGPKPVDMGKEYDVQISEISRQGDGIARIQGFVIFVKGAKVGEKTKIRVTNVGTRFATSKKVEGGGGPAAQQPQEPKLEEEQVAPPVTEEEKPELQDYKSQEEEPPTG
jgi:predicted RNA-binding protein with TRAM domain